jgi:hypothetical protein
MPEIFVVDPFGGSGSLVRAARNGESKLRSRGRTQDCCDNGEYDETNFKLAVEEALHHQVTI